MVHPVPGGHVLLVRVPVPPLQQPPPVRSDPQWQDQRHVGGVLPVETSSSVLWLGHFQVFTYWSSQSNVSLMRQKGVLFLFIAVMFVQESLTPILSITFVFSINPTN